MTDPESERRLINRCKAGDAEAYGRLVSLYQDRVFNLAYRLLGNAEDAADATQEAFMKAYRALPRFRGESRYATWIYRIAVNTAHSLGRRRRTDAKSLAPGASLEDGAAQGASGGESDPFRRAVVAEEGELAQRALARLEEAHRQVVVLHDVEGCSYEEIAGILGCARGTVKSRLHRAREALRRMAGEVIGEGAPRSDSGAKR